MAMHRMRRARAEARAAGVRPKSDHTSCASEPPSPVKLEASDFLAALVESSDDAIIGQSLDGMIVSWNAAAEKLYGYPRDEVLGRSIALLIPPDRREELPQIMARLRRAERVGPFETVRLRKAGQPVEVSLTISPIRDGNGHLVGASAIARDISGRKRGEFEEREALARLRAVVETAVDGIITIDLRGVIESVNPAAERIFGYSADELIGRNVSLLMPEPYRAEHHTYLANYLRTGERKIIGIGREVQGRRKDGSVFPMELAVSETRLGDRAIFTGIVRDIAARRQAEQALRVSEERFAAFMQHLPGAAWLKDLNGHYVYANPEAERVFSTSLEDLRGRTDHEVFPPETARPFRQNDQRALQELGKLQTIEVLRQADGVDHHSIVSKFAVPGVDGRPAYVGGVAFDITDRLAAEEALRDSEQRNRQLVQSLPVAVLYTCDAQGRITLYNKAAVALWGREPVLGQDAWCGSYRILETDGTPLPHERCPMAVALRAGRPIRGVEIVIERPDGTRRIVMAHPEPILDGSGKVVGAIDVLLDLTDRKRAEDELRASEMRFRLMADSAPTLIWMSGVDHECTWFNRRWLEFTGRRLEQEMEDGWAQSVHPQDLEQCLQAYHAAFDARDPFEIEYRLRRGATVSRPFGVAPNQEPGADAGNAPGR